MADANRWIAPVLGLPELPFVDFGDALLRDRPDGVHWKTSPLVGLREDDFRTLADFTRSLGTSHATG